MKVRAFLFTNFLCSVLCCNAQTDLTISGFDIGGGLSWTNSFTNGLSRVEYTTNLPSGVWLPFTNQFTSATAASAQLPLGETRFYRVIAADLSSVPTGMCFVPEGWFAQGDNLDEPAAEAERPAHNVYVNGFYMDRYETTKSAWDTLYAWATNNGYGFSNTGQGKAANHPIHTVNWYDCVKWCNARSEREGLTPCYLTAASDTNVYRSGELAISNDCVRWTADGYRLPTEAEREKAARGGLTGLRFPWGAAIDHAHANYRANNAAYGYDASPYSSDTYHPAYDSGGLPYTSPVDAFGANGYGLHDMAGNLHEWCWDYYGSNAYGDGSARTNPCGPLSGSARVLRGGNFEEQAFAARLSWREAGMPTDNHDGTVGFRTVRSAAASSAGFTLDPAFAAMGGSVVAEPGWQDGATVTVTLAIGGLGTKYGDGPPFFFWEADGNTTIGRSKTMWPPHGLHVDVRSTDGEFTTTNAPPNFTQTYRQPLSSAAMIGPIRFVPPGVYEHPTLKTFMWRRVYDQFHINSDWAYRWSVPESALSTNLPPSPGDILTWSGGGWGEITVGTKWNNLSKKMEFRFRSDTGTIGGTSPVYPDLDTESFSWTGGHTGLSRNDTPAEDQASYSIISGRFNSKTVRYYAANGNNYGMPDICATWIGGSTYTTNDNVNHDLGSVIEGINSGRGLKIDGNPVRQVMDTPAVSFVEKWRIDELCVKDSSAVDLADGLIHYFFDGYQLESGRFTSNIVTRTTAMPGSKVEIYQNNKVSETTGDADQLQYQHELYLDDSFCRAVLGTSPGNRAGYGNEIQIPVTWSDTQMTFTLRQGCLSALTGKTLTVFDDNNQPRVIGTVE